MSICKQKIGKMGGLKSKLFYDWVQLHFSSDQKKIGLKLI